MFAPVIDTVVVDKVLIDQSLIVKLVRNNVILNHRLKTQLLNASNKEVNLQHTSRHRA